MSGTWDPCEPALTGGWPGLKKAMAGAAAGRGRSYFQLRDEQGRCRKSRLPLLDLEAQID